MKRKNTLWSLVLALVMVLGVIAPLSALANNANEPADPKETIGTIDVQNDTSKTKPDSTTVVVHKLQSDSYE